MANSIASILEAIPVLLIGATVTLRLAIASIALGLLGGSLLGIARLSRHGPLRWASRIYIEFFRGTPLIVQLFMVYFGIPALAQSLGSGLRLTPWIAAILALSLNSSAYIAEIIRAGIQSIELGQHEASESLGLSQSQVMQYVIFPQALRRMIPPLGNEFIVMLKDTSIVSVIGFQEMFMQGKLIVARTYQVFEIYLTVALMYLVMTLVLSYLLGKVEVWLNPTTPSAAGAKPLELASE
ncbi:MAG: amino acid ABC transporter permease [Synechococcales cyanobacterium RU_4_20]|nr:amino acid ABC transporter permease [Synechococcales cyanobacterium RU_4_20]NJR68429.1 amino acid ABC transporter permease [Synechococcales cyanobacterium CRU_2_2]